MAATAKEELSSLAAEYDRLHTRFFETWQSNSVDENEALKAGMKQIAAETARLEEELEKVTSQSYTAKRELNITNMKAEQLCNDLITTTKPPKEEPVKKWENPAPKMRWTIWGKLVIMLVVATVFGTLLALFGTAAFAVIWIIRQAPVYGYLGWFCFVFGFVLAVVSGIAASITADVNGDRLEEEVML